MPEHIEGSLHVITMPLILQARIVVDDPIIVVGASDTGLAFLETLIFTKHIHFANLILISSNDFADPELLPFQSSNLYPSLRLKQLGFHGHVNFIKDTVIGIDRQEKQVKLISNRSMNYSYLILTPGKQFLSKLLDPGLANAPGVHGFNPTELTKVSAHLKHIERSRPGKIVIYGRSLQAYMAIEFCISLGLAPSRIHLINPAMKNDAFATDEIARVLETNLDSIGVNRYQGYVFEMHTEENGQIFSVQTKVGTYLK